MTGRWIVVCGLTILGAAIAGSVSLQPQTVHRTARKIPPGISVGDVVFFRTTTWRGRIVRSLQERGGNFTHAGVVVAVGDDGVRVVHASPVDPAIVKIDRLADLLTRAEIRSFAVYRPRVRADEAVKAALIVEGYAARQTPFDSDFELRDDRAVYCTELIWLAYRDAGLEIRRSRKILFPSDLVRTNFFEPLESIAEASRRPRTSQSGGSAAALPGHGEGRGPLRASR